MRRITMATSGTAAIIARWSKAISERPVSDATTPCAPGDRDERAGALPACSLRQLSVCLVPLALPADEPSPEAGARGQALLGQLVLSPTGRLLSADPPAGDLLGVPPAALRRRSLTTLVIPAHAARVRPFLAQLATGGEPRTCDVRLALTGLWVRLVAPTDDCPGSDSHCGADARACALLRSANWSHPAAAALFRRTMANHAAVMLLIDSATGSIVECNRAAAEFYGWSRDELRQLAIQDINLLPPDQVAARMALARSRGRICFDFQHRRADGSVRDVTVLSSSFSGSDESLLLSIIHDVTEHKLADRALEQSHSRLEQLVSERTVALHQEVEERRRAEAELRRRIVLDDLLIDLSATLHRATAAELADVLTDIVRRTGQLIGSDRAFLCRGDTQCVWFAERLGARPEDRLPPPGTLLPGWLAALRRGEPVYFDDVAALPPSFDAAQRFLAARQVKSVLLLPVASGPWLCGLLGFEAIREQHDWAPGDRKMLSFLAEAVGAALLRLGQARAWAPADHPHA